MKPLLFSGEAGTGKTTALYDWVQEQGRSYIRREGQRILIMSFMHGARRRLEARFAESGVPSEVATLDHVALQIVNRWRGALRIERPVVPAAYGNGDQTALGTVLSFDAIAGLAAELAGKPTIGRLLAASYPAVVVDEAQDLDLHRCALLKHMAKHSALVVAADGFQRLSDVGTGCPVLEWLEQEALAGAATVKILSEAKRFESEGVLRAARALRSCTPVERAAIRVVACPNVGPMAAKILWTVMSEDRWKGDCTILTPAMGTYVDRLIASYENQLKQRFGLTRPWHRESSASVEADGLIADAERPDGPLTKAGRLVLAQAHRVASLSGTVVAPGLLHATARRFVHASRLHSHRRTPTRVVTTIHGAKNREFDYVFVVWPKNARATGEQQRRLLYNGITRARKGCMVLVVGAKADVEQDEVFALVGPIEDGSPQARKGSAISGSRRATRK